MNAVKIILSTLVIAICYGIIHDLITAHLCVEYFTIGHPKIIESNSPIHLALLWGVIATWWIAFPMGLVIAAFNYFGTNPVLGYNYVMKLILKLTLVMFVTALLAGIIGYLLTELDVIYLLPRLASQMKETKYSIFLAVGWAHTSSYLTGTFGSIVICRLIYEKRKERFLKLLPSKKYD